MSLATATITATCRCGQAWATGVQASEQWIDPVPPVLPLVARVPCPRCGARSQIVRVHAG